MRYRRDGNDFGLDLNGAAEVDANTCNEYDEFFVSTRADARRHRQYFEAWGWHRGRRISGRTHARLLPGYPAHVTRT